MDKPKPRRSRFGSGGPDGPAMLDSITSADDLRKAIATFRATSQGPKLGFSSMLVEEQEEDEPVPPHVRPLAVRPNTGRRNQARKNSITVKPHVYVHAAPVNVDVLPRTADTSQAQKPLTTTTTDNITVEPHIHIHAPPFDNVVSPKIGDTSQAQKSLTTTPTNNITVEPRIQIHATPIRNNVPPSLDRERSRGDYVVVGAALQTGEPAAIAPPQNQSFALLPAPPDSGQSTPTPPVQDDHGQFVAPPQRQPVAHSPTPPAWGPPGTPAAVLPSEQPVPGGGKSRLWKIAAFSVFMAILLAALCRYYY
ncbi:hypothetical protein K491DRAFT_685370 [Lophiostoma macrostomum CBS 122681]|uniref:Uncharacterized protein n=1 Tax=Lophiostoma macrostomum CBS 122681 TaxID=1314788 RepID=A0A6A6SMP9_9PLEO|nr:hypothetical protein K491DRAFT_685370 [Lophiostoma macrostomum CBS 122681]